VSEILTDSSITVRIHSDSRQAVKQLVESPALQDERTGCKIWEKLVAITERNTANVADWIWDMQEWRLMSWQTRWQKREVDETSQRQTLTWDQRSKTCSSSLCSHGTRNLRRQLKANRMTLQNGI